MRRWEQGSEFHSTFPGTSTEGSLSPWTGRSVLTGSGRDALQVVIRHGMLTRGWKRLHLPSYFCQEVVRSIRSAGIETVGYDDGPDRAFPNLGKAAWASGDAILVVNFFGLRPGPIDYTTLRAAGAEIIEDHTHDPWSDWAWQSEADWCVASLRKTLPVATGGVCWSPRSHTLPAEPAVTEQRLKAALLKTAGMHLKSLYLDGYPVEKDVYRGLQIQGEAMIEAGQASGMDGISKLGLSAFPIRLWRRRRLENHQALVRLLEGQPWLSVLAPFSSSADSCPFSGILLFDKQGRRDYTRLRLIQANVFPAVLWPLEEPEIGTVSSSYVDLSRRILSIHCDYRYTVADMATVADLILKFGRECE